MADARKKVFAHKVRVPPKGFQKIRLLGEGAYGDVYLVKRERDDKRLVCKVEREPSGKGHSKEIEILRRLDHDRIVRLHAYVDQPHNCQMILEHCVGGDLYDLIKKEQNSGRTFSEAFVRHVFLQLAEALAFIHAGIVRLPGQRRSIPGHWVPIIHRDIKPENIFLRATYSPNSFPQLVLGDFGCATDRLCSDFYTTASFQPPELPMCTRKGDVWMVGAVIHNLVHGFEPIGPKPADFRGDWIFSPRARMVFPLPSRYSSSLNQLMMKALTKSFADRPATVEMLDAILDS